MGLTRPGRNEKIGWNSAGMKWQSLEILYRQQELERFLSLAGQEYLFVIDVGRMYICKVSC